jgi:hypothetical protein
MLRALLATGSSHLKDCDPLAGAMEKGETRRKDRGLSRRKHDTAGMRKILFFRLFTSIYVVWSLLSNPFIPKQGHGRARDLEQALVSLRGAKNEAPQPEQERGLSSEVIRVPLQGDESEQAGATKRETLLCFISSIFGENVKDADQPQNVENVFPNATSPVEFFLFTNLKDLPTP